MDMCNIVYVGKNRNGKARYWCVTHHAPASDRRGIKLRSCLAKQQKSRNHQDEFCLVPSDYAGGVALWGSTLAVYDTTPFPVTTGIHVHARKTEGGPKEIDRTFSSVKIKYNGHTTVFDADAAISYLCANVLNQGMEYVECPYCGSAHLDKDRYAVTPHKKHLCTSCGRYFYSKYKNIGNPIIHDKQMFGDEQIFREIVHPKRVLNIRQCDFPYGISLWGSTGAFLWTAKKHEEYGIHIHAYQENNLKPTIDETFDLVTIDGIALEVEPIRMYMVQKTLPFLQNRIAVVQCEKCGKALFDAGENAFTPSKSHICVHCGYTTVTHRKIISNPAVQVLEQLHQFSNLPLKNVCIEELYPDLRTGSYIF